MTEPPKDIMGGWRVLPDPADPPEWRHKMGYEDTLLKHRARQWLAASHPHLTPAELVEEAQKATYAFYAARPTYRQISDARAARGAWEAEQRWLNGEGSRDGLTKPEWEFLAFTLQGTNDPAGQSIYQRALEALA